MEQLAQRPPMDRGTQNSSCNTQESELLAITAAAVSDLGYTNEASCFTATSFTNDQLDGDDQHITNPNVALGDVYANTFSKRVASSSSASGLEDLNQTNQSQNSVASSALLNGTATRVKISSRKLKQIKSPFDVSVPGVEAHDISNMSLTSNNSTTEYHQVDKVTGKKQIDVPVFVQKHKSGKILDNNHPSGHLNGNFSKEIVGTITDSGYATHNVQIIHEIEGEEVSQNTSNEEMQSLNNYTLEGNQDRVVQAVHHEGGSQNSSCTQPEIVTVENGVAVSEGSSGHGSGTASQASDFASQQTAESNEFLEDRFSRFQPALLKQGSLESGRSVGSSTDNKDQIQIKNFSLDEKHKIMRQQFVKRQQQGPVKKLVQPRIVTNQPQKKKVATEPTDTKGATVSNMQDTVQTAAVVAASAVAATQPFLKAQLDVESKMAMILQKLAAQEEGEKSAVYKSVLDDKTQLKVEELERQLGDITQRRLDYLEKLQEQQMAWQAQLISVSQGNSHQQDQQTALKTKQVQHMDHQSHLAFTTVPVYEDILKEKAVLHTPAPRRKPPQPTSMYEDIATPPTKTGAPKTTSGGFLAHILAQQEETPKHSPFLRTPSTSPHRFRNEASPTVKKAQHLLTELTGLNEEVQHAVVSGSDQSVHKTYSGPAPLDKYMSKVVDIPPSSPYPSRVDVQSGDAPVSDNYADAQATLKEVKKTQGLLEDNIQAILRARQESQVYATLDQITYGSSPERVRIRKMVDEHIHSMSSDMEREIMDELLRIEEKKKQVIMIPERDTTITRGRKNLYPGGLATTRTGSRAKTEARVDTGLKRSRPDTRGLTSIGKENKPLKTKPKAPKLETASRKSIYGKSAHEGQRSTQKQPYLRYQNLPTPKKQPPPQVKTVRGVPVATAKTQTRVSAAKQPLYYYETDKKHGSAVASQPLQPALGMPVAIPLGVPRRVGSIPLPTQAKYPAAAVAPSPIAPLHRPTAASTPLVGTGGNVGMVEVKEDFSEVDSVGLEERDGEVGQRSKPQLSKQILPSVNIETRLEKSPQHTLATVVRSVDVNESPTRVKVPSETAVPPMSARGQEKMQAPKSPLQTFVNETKHELQETLDEAQYLEDTFEDEDSEGIALPGFKRPAIKEYLGPEFPPQLAPKPELDPTSDVIAADIRRRDLLSNRAVSWVEQELMARVISEMSSKQGALKSKSETIGHTTPVPKRTKKHKYKDNVETESIASDTASQHDSLIAEALGQEGFQLFVNAGQEVDENLVHALIKEVLLEKVQNRGQRTSRDDEGMHYSGAARKTKSVTSTVTPRTAATSGSGTTVQTAAHSSSHTRVKRVASPPMQIPDTPVPTPEPTPRGSPHAASPPRYRVATPPETPDLTPEPSLAEGRADIKQPTIQPVYYSDEEEEEQGYHLETAAKRPAERYVEPQHTVDTPVNTPPPSLPEVTARTPSPSQQDDYTPIPSEAEEVSQHTTPPPTPPLIQQTLEPTVVKLRSPETPPAEPELQERGQQYTPPPAPSSEEEITDTDTTSWNTVSETNNEAFSEGQWLISQNSDGEVNNPNREIRKRIKQKMLHGNLQLSQEDTLNEALELDQDTLNASHSEGEILDRHKPVMNEPYLMMLANMKPNRYGLPYGGHPKMQRDRSVGEISDYMQQGEYGGGHRKNNGGGSRRRVIQVTQQQLADDLQSPGELQDGFAPTLQQKKWPRADDKEEAPPIHSPEEQHQPNSPSSPPPPPLAPPTGRTITVRPTTPEEPTQTQQQAPHQGGGAGRAASPGARRIASQSPGAAGSSRLRGKDNMGGPGGRSLSPGLRPQISAGGRPPSPDKRLQRREEGRRSYEGLYGTVSDKDSLTMTPDQMNVDVLLNSNDYFGNTQSELLTTDYDNDGNLHHSTGDFGGVATLTQSYEPSQEIQVEVRDSRQSYDYSGYSNRGTGDSHEFREGTGGRRGFNLHLVETPGSTSDMSLPEGLTQTLEREESEKLSFTVDSESDLKMSGKYPDSLEGTANGQGSESRITRINAGSSGTHQVSITMPLMEEDEPSEENDLSHLSLT